ncbi:MAG: aminotransferase class I/II-fold pyridoxal phosphate-dependent enzyme, partial [Clostridium sp.]|nr:aminotransferase class I/II-fold pyridoxal phosphate-dependent enzyme [Clostridium sp.]
MDKSQKTKFIPYGRQWIDEDDIKAVVEVLRGDYLTTGPKIKEFEESLTQYTGAKFAVAVSNGTAALHAACFAAGIKEGDEVITSPITFAAS